jgi:hypothetical protein
VLKFLDLEAPEEEDEDRVNWMDEWDELPENSDHPLNIDALRGQTLNTPAIFQNIIVKSNLMVDLGPMIKALKK